jgi:hypothetical protein
LICAGDRTSKREREREEKRIELVREEREDSVDRDVVNYDRGWRV